LKLILENTSKIVELNGVPARVWEGKTESGIACHAFITRVAVATPSYKIANEGSAYTSITCLLCNRLSYNPNDVEKKYCGNCHIFHDQVHKQFETELQETRKPQAAAIEALPLRMVL
jgi:hypothetical protein